MSTQTKNVIVGTGSYIPQKRIPNEDFLAIDFYDSNQQKLPKANREIVDKFLEITTIEERRYVENHLSTSDIASFAAAEAIADAGIDKETLDYIIVAHNFGDVCKGDPRTDIVPSLAARVKHKLEIHNPGTVAYDMIFGCPGWLESLIQAHYFLKSGEAKRALVIGADILSRISDPHDRDSMLYADGAGAVILEARESDSGTGILAHKTRSDTLRYSQMLFMGPSYNPENAFPEALYLKMHGRKLYQYALETVPPSVIASVQLVGEREQTPRVLAREDWPAGRPDDVGLILVKTWTRCGDYAWLFCPLRFYSLPVVRLCFLALRWVSFFCWPFFRVQCGWIPRRRLVAAGQLVRCDPGPRRLCLAHA